MGTVILIGTVAIIVAIVGCAVIWRVDAARADEVENQTPPPPRVDPRGPLGASPAPEGPRSIDS